MKTVSRTVLGIGLVAALWAFCWVEGVPGRAMAAQTGANPPPDATHIPFKLPKDLVWTGSPEGEQQIKLFGDASKPGPYGILIRWNPGHFSHPHFHNSDRWIYVVSGTWWVSSSPVYDEKKMYPLPAGTFATDIANTIHWDGAQAGGPPTVLELVGMGPVITTQVDETGKPKGPGQMAK